MAAGGAGKKVGREQARGGLRKSAKVGQPLLATTATATVRRTALAN